MRSLICCGAAALFRAQHGPRVGPRNIEALSPKEARAQLGRHELAGRHDPGACPVAHLTDQRDTSGYLAEIAKIPDPADRLRRLIANAVRLSQRRNVYAALSQVDSEPVQAVLQRVAEQRIAFLTGLYADLGLPPQRARLLARLAYATYIGLMRITAEAPAAPLSTEDLEAFTDEATRALLPPAQ